MSANVDVICLSDGEDERLHLRDLMVKLLEGGVGELTVRLIEDAITNGRGWWAGRLYLAVDEGPMMFCDVNIVRADKIGLRAVCGGEGRMKKLG